MIPEAGVIDQQLFSLSLQAQAQPIRSGIGRILDPVFKVLAAVQVLPVDIEEEIADPQPSVGGEGIAPDPEDSEPPGRIGTGFKIDEECFLFVGQEPLKLARFKPPALESVFIRYQSTSLPVLRAIRSSFRVGAWRRRRTLGELRGGAPRVPDGSLSILGTSISADADGGGNIRGASGHSAEAHRDQSRQRKCDCAATNHEVHSF
jgi:hypothetical protein